MDRSGCGCLGGIVFIVAVVIFIWFAIATESIFAAFCLLLLIGSLIASMLN